MHARTSETGRVLVPIGALGVAVFQSWYLCIFNSPLPLASGSSQSNLLLVLSISGLLTQICTLLLFSMKPSLVEYIVASHVLLPSACLGSLGTVLVFFAAWQGAPLHIAIPVAGAVLVAVSKTVLLLAWGDAYSRMPSGVVSTAAATFCALAALFYLLLTYSSNSLSYLTIVPLPILSFMILSMYRKHATGIVPRVERSNTRYSPELSLFLYFSIFAVALGYMNGLGVYLEKASGSMALQLLFSMFILFGLLLPYSRSEFNLSLGAAVLLIGGLGALSLGYAVGVTSIGAGWICFEVLAWSAMTRAVQTRRVSPSVVMSRCWLVFETGMLVGLLIGVAVDRSFGPASSPGIAISMGLAFIAVACMLAAVKRPFADTSATDETPLIADGDLYYRQCMIVAERYSLTPREREVLVLISHGRDIGFIEKALHVSRNTAKAHIKHIYQRVGVNDKQSLLDVIASTDPGAAA